MQIAPINSARRFWPGHLLEPFSWAAEPLARIIKAEPQSLAHLFAIDRSRMHLIALALSHLDGDISTELSELLFRGTVRSVTERIFRAYPNGIKRALRHLPPKVLMPQNYQFLIELLSDHSAAKCLRHLPLIDDAKIQALRKLPSSLRTPCILRALDSVDQADGFFDGLCLLASRGEEADLEKLVRELALISNVVGLASRINRLVETLYFPTTFPPSIISKARRIDQPAEIRELARSWKNCLAGYLHEINTGIIVVYIWEDDDFSALCSVNRCGRLGWFLRQVKDGRNDDIDSERLANIRCAFEAESVPPYRVVAAIEQMCQRRH